MGNTILEMSIVQLLILLVATMAIIAILMYQLQKIPSEYKMKGFKGIIDELLISILCIAVTVYIYSGDNLNDIIEMTTPIFDKIKSVVSDFIDTVFGE